MIYQGDCLSILKTLESSSVDSLITDPPAGISFMGKSWDSGNNFIPWLTEIMKECLRVLKPGAHGLVWALPRTSHWTATALEAAGFDIRDVITHVFGSGFPKSHNLFKATQDKRLEGWGTALKPASEHWILVRKPLSEKTVAANVLKHGTGGINIDASRIGTEAQPASERDHKSVTGRFPANLILSHNADCVEVGTKKVKGEKPRIMQIEANDSIGTFKRKATTSKTVGGNEDGTETVAAFECTPGCAVQELDRHSGFLKPSGNKAPSAGTKFFDKDFKARTIPGINSYASEGGGGASRFFYCAKASKKDKGSDNTHPTVKSSTLMSYLIKLITPPEGTVLDPFMGSGSTGVAAKQNGFTFIGIEKEKEYFQIAERRIMEVQEWLL